MFLNLTVFGRRNGWYNTYNLIPFKTIIEYLAFPNSRDILVNFIGNIFVLMPIEFLIVKIFDIKKIKLNLIVDFFIAFSIEIIQLISHTGVFDIDDIILNIVGMSMMYLLVTKKYDFLVKHKDKMITSVISFIFLIMIFYSLNWYYLGNIPTISVFFRLIFFFIIIEIIVYKIYIFIKNKIKKVNP